MNAYTLTFAVLLLRARHSAIASAACASSSIGLALFTLGFGGLRARKTARRCWIVARARAGSRRCDGRAVDTNHPECRGGRVSAEVLRSARGEASAASRSPWDPSSAAPSSGASRGTGSSGSTCRSGWRSRRSRESPVGRDAAEPTATSISAAWGIIASAGLFAIAGASSAPTSRVAPPRFFGTLAVGVALMVFAFVCVRAAFQGPDAPDPLLPQPNVQRAPMPPRCSCSSGCSAGVFPARPVLPDRARAFAAVRTGLRILPWTAMPIIVAPTAGALSDRINGRSPDGDRARAARHRPALDRARASPRRRRTRTSSCPSSSAASAWGMFFAPVANVVLSSVSARRGRQGVRCKQRHS